MKDGTLFFTRVDELGISDECLTYGCFGSTKQSFSPCHHIPGGKASSKTIQATDDSHPRIEAVFNKYFHRADYDESMKEAGHEAHHYHEVEIIVCHGTFGN